MWFKLWTHFPLRWLSSRDHFHHFFPLPIVPITSQHNYLFTCLPSSPFSQPDCDVPEKDRSSLPMSSKSGGVAWSIGFSVWKKERKKERMSEWMAIFLYFLPLTQLTSTVKCKSSCLRQGSFGGKKKQKHSKNGGGRGRRGLCPGKEPRKSWVLRLRNSSSERGVLTQGCRRDLRSSSL